MLTSTRVGRRSLWPLCALLLVLDDGAAYAQGSSKAYEPYQAASVPKEAYDRAIALTSDATKDIVKWVRSLDDGEERQLTFDGEIDFAYGVAPSLQVATRSSTSTDREAVEAG